MCAMMMNPCVRQNVTGFKLIYDIGPIKTKTKYRAERGTAEDGKCKRFNTPVIINFLKKHTPRLRKRI